MAKKTVAKTSKKKITAPVAYKPTKGRPREYLAYLNQREMDFLRSINGGNMERGPRGLPSFPPNDAIGSSSVSSGTKTGTSSGPGGPNGPNSGPSKSTSGTAPGGGGGGGGGSTGTRGSSTGPVGSGSGYNAPGNTGGGSQLGGGNKGSTTGARGPTGPGGEARTSPAGSAGGAPGSTTRTSGGGSLGGGGKGPSSSLNAPARTAPSASSGGSKGPSTSLNAPARTAPSAAKSPMSGQDGSFKTPDKATSYNKDQIDRQKTQVNDAKQGLNNTPAAGKDLTSGGITTLNVGPMQTPVRVNSYPQSSYAPEQNNRISKSITDSIKLYREGFGSPHTTTGSGYPSTADFSRATMQGTLEQYRASAPSKQITDRVPELQRVSGESPISKDAAQRITEAYKAPFTQTQPRDELGPMPANIPEDQYGWAGTGPSKLAAYQSNKVYGANVKEPITQEQYDTLLAVNTGLTPDIQRAVMGMSPQKRRGAAVASSAARMAGYDVPSALETAAIESGFGSAKNRPGSSYQGLMQMGPGEFEKYANDVSAALGRNNPWASAQAGIAYKQDIADIIERNTNIQKPGAGDIYGGYQQGPWGYSDLVNNPDKLAKDVVGRDKVAQNLGPGAPGTADTITAGEFAKYVSSQPERAFLAHTGYSPPQKQITDRVPEEQGFVAGISNTTPPAGYKEAMPKEYGPLGENAYDRIPAEIESGPNRGIASLNPGYVGPVNDPRLQYSSGAFPAREPSTYAGGTLDPASDLQKYATLKAKQGSLYARDTTATVNSYKDVTQTGSPELAGGVPTVSRTPGPTLPTDPRIPYAATGGIPVAKTPYRDVVPTGSPIMAGGVPSVPGGIGARLGTEMFGPPNLAGLSTNMGGILQEQYDKNYIANLASGVLSGLPSAETLNEGYAKLRQAATAYDAVKNLPVLGAAATQKVLEMGRQYGVGEYIGQGIEALKGVVENSLIAAVQAGSAMGAPVVDIEGAQRAAETVSRAEDRYRTDRAPPSDDVATKEIDAEKILDIEDVPPEQRSMKMQGGLGMLAVNPISPDFAFSSGKLSPEERESIYNAADIYKAEVEGPPSYTRVPTYETFSPYSKKTYDTPYPVDENGVPIQEVSPEDMAKMQLRRRGLEKYEPTAEEKASMVVGGGLEKLFGALGKTFRTKEQMEDYLSRTSWEQEYAEEKADRDRAARESAGRLRAPGSKSSGFPGSGVSTSGPGGGITDIGTGGKNEYRPPDTYAKPRVPQATVAPTGSGTPAESGERPAIYYSWDVGVNIPSPNDPDYTLYLRYLQERAAAQAALGIG